ncbi:polysaccharide pyruvyl transferase CsaB [Bacillus taeanensis]|uniref:Polysaccharide pyruvyl transferase CsaB n=1 Tax=Bacillus taeanensis TaxID=273032 RepID=A0A366XTX3_9BACI|nr:polysaccharide pyruvyl transferase CsaB [Bacillus taeanensis]RBW67594.1 polysaccharide pyruvyl transferase CsaB [Bacillus taeanensis]
MRVVLSGYYGFNNVGDEAILYSIIASLKKQHPAIEIVVLSNDPAYTEKTYRVKAVNRWKIPEIMKTLKNADGLISGGGSLLQDKTGRKTIPYYLGIMMMAVILRKPFFIYAQGIGPVAIPYHKRFIKHVLSKAAFISVRDKDSKKLLEEIGIKKPIELVPDPVLGIDVIDEENNWFTKQNFQGNVISVSVRDWPSEQNYLQKIAGALDRCVQAGSEVVFIPMHGEHDDITSKRAAEMMKEKSVIAPYDAEIHEKVAFIGASDLLVGMRLHALIFAAVTHTPFVALSYDPKIDSFAEMAEQPQIGHVDDEWQEEELFNMLSLQLREKVKEETKLKFFTSRLKLETSELAQKVVQALKK